MAKVNKMNSYGKMEPEQRTAGGIILSLALIVGMVFWASSYHLAAQEQITPVTVSIINIDPQTGKPVSAGVGFPITIITDKEEQVRCYAVPSGINCVKL